MKYGIVLTLLCLFLSNSLLAQRKKESEDSPYKEGIVYALPRSVVRIVVEAEKESFFHGPYYKFADQLLGLNNAPSEDQVKWELTDFEIETHSEVDPNAYFMAVGKKAAMVSLSSQGILLGVNVTAVNQVAEYSSPVRTFIEGDSIPDIIFPDRSMHSFIKGVDSVGIKIPLTLEEKAIEAAHDITKIRKRLFKTLAAGYEQLHPDGLAYQIMVNELKALENEYVALFMGKSFKQRYRFVYEYTPKDKSVKGEVIFRFSSEKGVVPSTDLSARPIVLEILKDNSLAGIQAAIASKFENPYAGSSGIYYRLPGSGKIRLMSSGNLLADKRAVLPQFGTIAAFPEIYLGGDYSIELHPSTGAIKNISLKDQKK